MIEQFMWWSFVVFVAICTTYIGYFIWKLICWTLPWWIYLNNRFEFWWDTFETTDTYIIIMGTVMGICLTIIFWCTLSEYLERRRK